MKNIKKWWIYGLIILLVSIATVTCLSALDHNLPFKNQFAEDFAGYTSDEGQILAADMVSSAPVSVSQGDTLWFGPCNVAQYFHLVGLDGSGNAATDIIRSKEYTWLNRLLDLDRKIAGWQEGVQKLKLPAATADHVLPQDDDFMTLPEIDLTPYRAGEKKLRQDYPYPTYTRLKVSKQADVMNLFLLREEMFPETVKKASLRYYEPLCVHESSLSLCAYSMLAADCGEQKQAYDLFARARAIDQGLNMRSSDEGIHTASLGGVWQCCVLGFCGVRLCADQLRIIPNLPECWTGATVRIWWRGSQLELTATHKEATVRVLQGNPELSVLTSKGLLRGSGSISWEL